jgi:lysophospholipase L1-like esterase
MKMGRKLNIRILISLLFSILGSFACGKEQISNNSVAIADTTPHPATDTIVNKDTVMISSDTSKFGSEANFLALGDSYTIGQSVAESERFPAQTVQLLAAENIPVKNPDYIAVSGWTTQNLKSAILAKNPAKNYDVVTLLIGVNDQYQGGNINEYGDHFLELLNKAIELAGNRKRHVFVLSIPDYSATPFVAADNKQKVSKQIDAFNAVNKQITLDNGIVYIDITPSTQLASSDPSLIASDSLHPSAKEYTVWARLLAPAIRKVLQ